jgi:hypothetical protein
MPTPFRPLDQVRSGHRRRGLRACASLHWERRADEIIEQEPDSGPIVSLNRGLFCCSA